ncbi:MAG: hypothetical protein IPG92_10395 [Flavobacteriales bacterium]|nr:hypothetical protein [Flavobacteriales bacterium]
MNDVLNLMPLLAQVPEADTSRIGLFGTSRGGLMTSAWPSISRTPRILD